MCVTCLLWTIWGRMLRLSCQNCPMLHAISPKDVTIFLSNRFYAWLRRDFIKKRIRLKYRKTYTIRTITCGNRNIALRTGKQALRRRRIYIKQSLTKFSPGQLRCGIRIKTFMHYWNSVNQKDWIGGENVLLSLPTLRFS